MASTELVTIEQVEDVLLHGGEFDIVSTDEIQEDMVRRILASETLEDAFASFKTTSVKDVEGIALDINGVAWCKSGFKEGAGVFALLKATIADTDEQITLSMGGRTLMASFVWAQRNEKMPMRGVFKYEQSNANGERKFLTFKLT